MESIEPLVLHLDLDRAILLRNHLMYSRQSLTDDRAKVQAVIDAIDVYLKCHLGEKGVLEKNAKTNHPSPRRSAPDSR